MWWAASATALPEVQHPGWVFWRATVPSFCKCACPEASLGDLGDRKPLHVFPIAERLETA